MHEMGIAMQIVEIAAASIPKDMEKARVARVNLVVGKFAAVVPESLRFCFDVVSRETPLAGAELHIEEVPVTARCNECRHEWSLSGPEFHCPSCKGGRIEILTGRELDIQSIEITEGQEEAADDAARQ